MDKTAAELTEAARERIKPKNFALPKQRKYPIHDLPHARNALARAAQHASPSQEALIRRRVYEKFPGLKERAKEASVKISTDIGAAEDEMRRRRTARTPKNMGIGPGPGGFGGAGISGALQKSEHQNATESQQKKASVELPEEVEKLAAAIAIGVTLADEDLLGMKKEAMDIAARLMVKGAQGGFWDQVAGMGANYAAGAPGFLRGPGLGTGEAPAGAGEWVSGQFYPDVIPTEGPLVASVTPDVAPTRMDLGTTDVLRAVEPSPGATPPAGDMATLLGGGPPAEMAAGVAPDWVYQTAEAAKALSDSAKAPAQVGPTEASTMVSASGPDGLIQINPGAGVHSLSPEEIAALSPGVTGISPTLGVPAHSSYSYAPAKGGMEINAALQAALDRERAISLNVLEKAGALEKQALSMDDISSWLGARGQEAQSAAQTILDWARANPEAAGAILGAAGGAGVGALAAGKGKRGKGALIGGGLGGLGGLAAGHALGRHFARGRTNSLVEQLLSTARSSGNRVSDVGGRANTLVDQLLSAARSSGNRAGEVGGRANTLVDQLLSATTGAGNWLGARGQEIQNAARVLDWVRANPWGYRLDNLI